MKKLTVEDIDKLEGKCITVPYARIERMPIAFLKSMQFRVVMNYIKRGVYEYVPKTKEKSPWDKKLKQKRVFLLTDVK